MAIYDVNGNSVGVTASAVNYDAVVKAVNHRGYNTVAPENTLPAYILSRQNGFSIAETDISFTSDGVAVLLHDATINRTARNADGSTIGSTINISSITYEQALEYDFGIWKGAKYAGTKIPTLEQFLDLCRNIGLIPYIELKNNGGYTQAQIEGIVDAVNAHGLKGKATYISFSDTYLGYVKNHDESARLGYLNSTASAGHVATVQNLKTSSNEVYYGVKYSTLTDAICEAFATAKIPIEVWTVNSASDIIALNPYITGVTSDSLIAGKILYESNIS